jgi:hypothetical protein
VWNGWVWLVGGFQTSCWVLRKQPPLWWGFFLVQACLSVAVWWRGAGWPLFENCTVDASIFVVKLPRANGGCLGTRSR